MTKKTNKLDATKKVLVAPFHGVSEIEVSILSDILYKLRPRLYQKDETRAERVEAVEKAKAEILEHIQELTNNKVIEARIDERETAQKFLHGITIVPENRHLFDVLSRNNHKRIKELKSTNGGNE